MKHYLFRMFVIGMAIFMCVAFTACGDDENDGMEQTNTKSEKDPDGTIVLNMLVGEGGNYYELRDFGKIHIDEAYNFEGEDWYDIEFIAVGAVGGLSQITEIPTTGWTEHVAVVPGTGYVLRRGDKYARLFVVDYTTIDGKSGATVKYQSPFLMPIKFDKSTLNFSSAAEEQSLFIMNPTQYVVKDKPEWCNVSNGLDAYNEIVVSVQGNPNTTKRSGVITFSNSLGEVSVPITQSQVETIDVNKKEIKLKGKGGRDTITLKKPTYYEITSLPTWVKKEVLSSTEIVFTAADANSVSTRSGNIILKNKVNEVIIKVSQDGLFAGGTGTESNPYQIKTAEQLRAIQDYTDADAYFILVNDIDLSSYLATTDKGWTPIEGFSGTFNGNNHTIKNLWANSSSNVGLFGSLNGATVKNLKVIIGTNGLRGGHYVGGICCAIGYSQESHIVGCSVSGKISGTDEVGGICATINEYTHISKCYTEGEITSGKRCGAICGDSWDWGYGEVEDCYSTATLNGSTCYFSVGQTKNCYFAGTISKTSFTFAYNNNATKCYYDSDKIGRNVSVTNATTYARTTAQMMAQSTYTGWDFTNTWKITEGKTYPTLRCFNK